MALCPVKELSVRSIARHICGPYEPGKCFSPSAADAAVPGLTVLSTLSAGASLHVEFQWKEKVSVIVMYGEEDIPSHSTVCTV
jgi:hypothetical protein